MTVKEHVVVFPSVSLAVQVTRVVPIGKKDPDGGEQKLITSEQLSEAVGDG